VTTTVEWRILSFEQAFHDVTAGNHRVDQSDYLDSGILRVVDQGQAQIAGYVNDIGLACRAQLPCLVFGDHTKIVKYVDYPFAIGAQGVRVLLPAPELDIRFAFYALQRVRFPADTGYTRHSRFLKRSRIAFPPLAEQRRIAALLDKADEVSRKRQESLRTLDEFLRSAFLEMFGGPVAHPQDRMTGSEWRQVTMEDLVAPVENACAGGPFGSDLTTSDYVTVPGIPVIRGNNVTVEGAFRDEGFVFVSEAKAAALKRNLALPGDVVVTQRGTLGQIARIPRAPRFPRYLISQSQMKLTVNEEVVEPEYLVHYFLSPRAKADLASRTLATGVPHINLSILRAFPVVLPPLALQHRFAALLAQHVATRRRMETATFAASTLFDSLAYQTFGGPAAAALSGAARRTG
jgi:type I restriction enzyme S subunit